MQTTKFKEFEFMDIKQLREITDAVKVCENRVLVRNAPSELYDENAVLLFWKEN
jgi:hypothetical protein